MTPIQGYECHECGEYLPPATLSQMSLSIAGTRSKPEACITLPASALVCYQCYVNMEDTVDYDTGTELGRTELEAWELSGLTIDPARWQAHQMNY